MPTRRRRRSPPSPTSSRSNCQRLIMSPPPYPYFGKNARDVSKGYYFVLVKLDVNTKTASGFECNTGTSNQENCKGKAGRGARLRLGKAGREDQKPPSGFECNTAGTSNQENGKVFDSLETKYKVKEHGLSFAEKWNTDNTLGTEVSVQDQLLKGLKLTESFSPQSGSKSSKVKAAFQNDLLALNGDVDLDSNGPILQGSAVFNYQRWLAGYDTNNNKLTKNNFAVGFSTGDFILHTNVDLITESADGQEFAGSIFQRVSPKFETGFAWSSSGNNNRFGIGAKYDLDKDASIRAKINNSRQLGPGYQQRLRDGITLTLSAIIDGKNFDSGGHKIGLGLESKA